MDILILKYKMSEKNSYNNIYMSRSCTTIQLKEKKKLYNCKYIKIKGSLKIKQLAHLIDILVNIANRIRW